MPDGIDLKALLSRLLALVLVALAAAWLGSLGADSLNHRKWLEKRRFLTDAYLSSAGALHIGDTMPDLPLEDEKGNEVRLSQIAKGTTLLVFVDIECLSCRTELLTVRNALGGHVANSHVRILFSDHAAVMCDTLEQLGILALATYDRGDKCRDVFSFSSHPFSAVIDSHRRVTEIIAGPLTAGEVRQFRD